MALLSTAAVKEMGRLTYADSLISTHLESADAQLIRARGPHWTNEDFVCEWDLKSLWRQWATELPRELDFGRQIESVSQVLLNDSPVETLLSQGRFLTRNLRVPFWGDVKATVKFVDDTAERKQILFDLTMATLVASARRTSGPNVIETQTPEEALRSLDSGFSGLLPDRVRQATGLGPGGQAAPDNLYHGTLVRSNSPIQLANIGSPTPYQDDARLRIQPFTEERLFLWVAQRHDKPDFFSLVLSGALGINYANSMTKRRNAFTVDGVSYDAWITPLPWISATIFSPSVGPLYWVVSR